MSECAGVWGINDTTAALQAGAPSSEAAWDGLHLLTLQGWLGGG